MNYFGIFFSGKSGKIIRDMEVKKLIKSIKNLHCTFSYKPTELEIQEFNNIVGKEIECELIAYGNDGKNSGFLIKFPEEYDRYYINTDKDGKEILKHITVSISEDSKLVFTSNLKFFPINPVKIIGRFGYYTKKGKKPKYRV